MSNNKWYVQTTVAAALLWVSPPLTPVNAGEWVPDHSLMLRPDGPGLESLAKSEPPDSFLLDGPSSPQIHGEWLDGLKRWRAVRKQELAYKDNLYERKDLEWTRQTFTQDQLLVWDRSLFDRVENLYTVERAVNEIEGRFGKLDSVLLWPGYPNVGLDGRNQFDLVRDMPGGLPALRKAVTEFHQRGVRVFLPVTMWDEGTREEGPSRAATAADLVRSIGADGINLDTLNSVPVEFRDFAQGKEPWIAIEPQFDTQNESLSASAISWNDWVLWEELPTPVTPRVSRVKWLEPRHMVAVTDRYPQNKVDSLQHAFFNGQGYVLIENFWGYWRGFSPRDAEAIRRFTRIERLVADNLISADWEPHVSVIQRGIFASRFPLKKRTVWTFVNRTQFDLDGEQLAVPARPGTRYFDLWHGNELTATEHNGIAHLSFPIESLGFGAVLADESSSIDPDLAKVLALTQLDAKEPLRSYPSNVSFTPQTMVAIPPTTVSSTVPTGMVQVPAAYYDFVVNGIEIENGNNPGVDVQFPWEDSPRRGHRQRIQIPRFFIDRTPVTNSAFKKFLDRSHYHPLDDHNFLRDWKKGTYPRGWSRKPVTWVSIEDARAYASWAGKRLPHVWEWQYAAQGNDGRIYPWGSKWDPLVVPPQDHSRTERSPTDVDAYPAGASPFGVLDMEGNVAQWTDEFEDAHTRAAVLRGGDFYRPLGSIWYFPKSYRLDEQEKYLLVAPSRDRSGVVGFRCVLDAER